MHEVAEELEHINSGLLVERLDEFLEFPKVDPHGDPIPDKHGNFADLSFIKLNKLKAGEKGTITGVSEHSSPFLRHLEKLGLTLGKQIEITEIIDFDGSVELLAGQTKINISKEVAKHILISK
ncbi:FeoA domain protein [compost metagenome]